MKMASCAIENFNDFPTDRGGKGHALRLKKKKLIAEGRAPC